jgi:outer membrane lipoprotein-sorting protein
MFKHIDSIFLASLIFSFLLISPCLYGQSEEERPEVGEVINHIDQLYRSESSYSEVEMKIITEHWERTLKMKVWTKNMDHTFIRITAPEKEEGVGTLRIENEMWNYLPKTNKVIKIPPSMMMNSWMGSDFTNDDLVKEFSLFDDYDYEYTATDNPVDSLYYIKCIPHEDVPVVWGSIVVAATKDEYIPVWEKYYDEDGNLARTLYFSDVTTFDRRRIPAVMEMVPEDEESRTILRYIELDFGVDLEEGIFTLRNLRSE